MIDEKNNDDDDSMKIPRSDYLRYWGLIFNMQTSLTNVLYTRLFTEHEALLYEQLNRLITTHTQLQRLILNEEVRKREKLNDQYERDFEINPEQPPSKDT